MTETLPAPALEHVWSLAIAVAPPLEIGLTAAGLRRVEPITGGVARGPLLNGRVLPGRGACIGVSQWIRPGWLPLSAPPRGCGRDLALAQLQSVLLALAGALQSQYF